MALAHRASILPFLVSAEIFYLNARAQAPLCHHHALNPLDDIIAPIWLVIKLIGHKRLMLTRYHTLIVVSAHYGIQLYVANASTLDRAWSPSTHI